MRKIIILIFIFMIACKTVNHKIPKYTLPHKINNTHLCSVYFNSLVCAKGDCTDTSKVDAWTYYDIYSASPDMNIWIKYNHTTHKIIYKSEGSVSFNTISFKDENNGILYAEPIFPYGGIRAFEEIINQRINYSNIQPIKMEERCNLKIFTRFVIDKKGHLSYQIIKTSGEDLCGFVAEYQRVLDGITLAWIPGLNDKNQITKSVGVFIFKFKLE